MEGPKREGQALSRGAIKKERNINVGRGTYLRDALARLPAPMAYLLPNGLILGAGLCLDGEAGHDDAATCPIGTRRTLLARILASV